MRGARRGDRLPSAFLSPLSGRQRSGASILVWVARLQNHGCEIHEARFAKPSGPARTDQVGYRKRLLPAALELENSGQGMAQNAGPGSVYFTRLLQQRGP